MADLATLRATVYGRVQGVYFRAFVAEVARGLDLAGFVRNLPDGAVEVIAEGERKRLENLLDRLGEGPPHAIVEKVDADWSAYSGDYTGFRVRY